MPAVRFLALLVAAFLGIVASSPAIPAEEAPRGDPRRGRYIVHHVAMCIYCHTPKDDEGRLVESQLLTGSPIPLKSPWPAQDWADEAPKIAGLPTGYEEKDLVRLLTEGVAKDGRTPKRPMPPFRMNRRDAADVAAYIASLKPPATTP